MVTMVNIRYANSDESVSGQWWNGVDSVTGRWSEAQGCDASLGKRSSFACLTMAWYADVA